MSGGIPSHSSKGDSKKPNNTRTIQENSSSVFKKDITIAFSP